ncbi:MAG: hypothetical protein KBA64_09640 [Armatimonadetes bacterium]|nr:hypothetical protein [Armatimonadota bacterium]NLN91180.1 hypothetical protein [candidate division WS1 bacterium]
MAPLSPLGRALGWLSPPARGAMGLLWIIAACVPSVTRPLGLSITATLALIGLLLAGGSLKAVGLRLVGVLSFTVLTVLGLAVLPSQSGATLVALPLGLAAPAEGLFFVLDIAVRAALLIAVALALGRVFTAREFLLALNGLPIPTTPRCLLYLSGLSLSRVKADLFRLFRARRARGGVRGWSAVRSSMSILGVLIVRAGRSAERQAFALQARGFADRFPTLDDESPSLPELVVAAVLGGVPVWLATLA